LNEASHLQSNITAKQLYVPSLIFNQQLRVPPSLLNTSFLPALLLVPLAVRLLQMRELPFHLHALVAISKPKLNPILEYYLNMYQMMGL